MPGLRKTEISQRFLEVLSQSRAKVLTSAFSGAPGFLPWQLTIEFTRGKVRQYSAYFWTISHGGKSRSANEYRIQTKLKAKRELQVEAGTTLLLGYYHEQIDKSGRAAGNEPPAGMEVFVAWNALEHMRLGWSSSCQVPFDLMYEAFLSGKASCLRILSDDSRETVLGFRPEYLSSYLESASGGHERVQLSSLRPAFS